MSNFFLCFNLTFCKRSNAIIILLCSYYYTIIFLVPNINNFAKQRNIWTYFVYNYIYLYMFIYICIYFYMNNFLPSRNIYSFFLSSNTLTKTYF